MANLQIKKLYVAFHGSKFYSVLEVILCCELADINDLVLSKCLAFYFVKYYRTDTVHMTFYTLTGGSTFFLGGALKFNGMLQSFTRI